MSDEYEMEYTKEDELLDRIAELEEKISVLLSCKNCPDNKGGYICQKEYEGKCLSQKIQYIKELKEEIAELEKENAELLCQKKKKNPRLWYCSLNCFLNNIKIRKTKLSVQEAEKLTKDWNNINNLIQKEERLNEW